MKLTILGSGTFFVDKDVTASAFVLETKESKILIDCGPGTLIKLAKAGIKPEDLDYVMITHFHPDHSSDLFPLFMNYRLSDFFEPEKLKKHPTFLGPEGFSDFLLKYSQLSELPAYEGYDKIKVEEYKPEMKLKDFTLKTFKTSHTAFNVQAKSYALRIEAEGKTIAFSGDAAKCEGLEKVSENADIFVCDTSYPKGKSAPSHLDTSDIGEIAKKSKVKKLILDHFYPQFSNYDLVGEVRDIYDGEVIKAKDLDIINI